MAKTRLTKRMLGAEKIGKVRKDRKAEKRLVRRKLPIGCAVVDVLAEQKATLGKTLFRLHPLAYPPTADMGPYYFYHDLRGSLVLPPRDRRTKYIVRYTETKEMVI